MGGSPPASWGRLLHMAELELRQVPASEALAFARTTEMGFGNVATDEDAEASATEIFDPEWAIGVYDAGQIVATAGAVPMELTLPAGPGRPFPAVAVPGVTAVAVLPTHRRRGLLNRMMAHQLDQFREREVPLAILTASESMIYSRYGYGLASSSQSVSIATRRSAFGGSSNDTAPAAAGRMRLVNATEAPKILPVIHEQARRLRPGEITRSKDVWHLVFRDPERHRHGAAARTYVVHESEGGAPDGYASYRYRHNWRDGLPTHTISVEDLYATSPSVDAALWRFVLDVDLVEEVTAGLRPLDEPLRWRLAEPRRLRTTGITDFLWARLVDIPAALAARGYNAETELVLQVEGPSTERVVLATAATGGSCRRAGDADHTDLVLGLSQLGAIFLGGCPPSVLGRAGQIEEQRPGALARADAAFASPLLPFCGTHF
jgi:predicted acetyltransferase